MWVEREVTTGIYVSVEASSPAEAQAKLFSLSEDIQTTDRGGAAQDALHEAFEAGEVQGAGIKTIRFANDPEITTSYNID